MSPINQNALKRDIPQSEQRLQHLIQKPLPDPLLDLEYISPVNQGRFATIGKLESSVSLLQSAQAGIDKINGWLHEIRQVLEGNDQQTCPVTMPRSVVNRFIEDRLALIEGIVKSTGFQSRSVLNGSYGVIAEVAGDRLKFVRGSARVATSPRDGFPVAIFQPPRSSYLSGSAQLTPAEVRQEKWIAVHDGYQEVRYRFNGDETPETLVSKLKQCFISNHIDVDVFTTPDNRLFFRHNQLGSKSHFKGMSYHTRLLSEKPGHYTAAFPGIDIAGTIGAESAHGDGGFLIGDKGCKQTDGLVVYYDGTVEYPGQIVGTIRTIQNGIAIPLDAAESTLEMLSLPSIAPTCLAVGVANGSGFENLASIRVFNESERVDALKLVIWSTVYLKFLSKELKQKESDYIQNTIRLLQGSASTLALKDDVLLLSKDKAADMVDQIREMLKKHD